MKKIISIPEGASVSHLGKVSMLSQTSNILIVPIMLSVLCVYLLHNYLDGNIISQRLPSLLFFSLFFIFFLWGKWPWNKKTELNNCEAARLVFPIICISMLSLLIMLSFWLWDSIGGDYRIHSFNALKLANGFKDARGFYIEMPNVYTPLSHALLAIVYRISGLSMPVTYFIITAVINFFIPVLAFRAGKASGLTDCCAIILATITALFGGLFFDPESRRMFWLYFPAVQTKFTYISRNLSFFLFLKFFIYFIRIYRNRNPVTSDVASAGVLIGLLGLTHPNGFVLGLFLFFCWAIDYLFLRNGNKKKSILPFFAFPGISLAGFYFIPLALSIIQFGGLIPIDDSVVTVPEALLPLAQLFPFFLLFVPYLAKGFGDRFVIFLTILVSIYLIIMGTKYFYDNESSIIILTRLHRYGPYFLFFIFTLATLGVQTIFQFGNKPLTILSIIFLMLVVLGGAYTNGQVINNGQFVSNFLRTFKPSQWKQKHDSMIQNWPPASELLKNIQNPETALVAPFDEIHKRKFRLLAFNSGVCFAYHNRPRVPFQNFYGLTLTQEKRTLLLQEFYNYLNSNKIVRKDILYRLSSSLFWAQGDKRALPECKIVMGLKGGYLYEVGFE